MQKSPTGMSATLDPTQSQNVAKLNKVLGQFGVMMWNMYTTTCKIFTTQVVVAFS